MLNDVNEKLENIQCSFLEWVTRYALEIVLEKFLSVVEDVNDVAGTNKKYSCLLCGKPKVHLAGMSLATPGPRAKRWPAGNQHKKSKKVPTARLLAGDGRRWHPAAAEYCAVPHHLMPPSRPFPPRPDE
jgi:hypothetical protein